MISLQRQGDAANAQRMERAICTQGNLSEYAPIFLILLRLFDQVATPALSLHVPGATLRRGHLMHAAVFVFLAPNVCLRLGRKILTLLAVLAAAGMALYSFGF